LRCELLFPGPSLQKATTSRICHSSNDAAPDYHKPTQINIQ
jgi:hypothetical protein